MSENPSTTSNSGPPAGVNECRLFLETDQSGPSESRTYSRPISPGSFRVVFNVPHDMTIRKMRWSPAINRPCCCRIHAVEAGNTVLEIYRCNTPWERDGMDEFLHSRPQYEIEAPPADAGEVRIEGELTFWDEPLLMEALKQAREQGDRMRQREIQTRQDIMAARERERHIRQIFENMRRERNAITRSWSWRLTGPFRLAARPLFRQPHRESAVRTVQHHASLPPLLPYHPGIRVSIAVPVRNGEQYLRETLRSVLRQTHASLEVVIVDDASTDSSPEIAASFARRDGRVRLLRNPSNAGMTANWNRALAACGGDWVLMTGQDDLLETDAIERMLRAARRGIRLVLAARHFAFEGNANQALHDAYTWELPTLETMGVPSGVITPERLGLLMADLPSPCTNVLGEPVCGLFRRELLEARGFYHEGLNQLSDYEFWLRCALHEPVVYLDHRLMTFRVHGQSATSANLDNHLHGVHLESAKLLLELLEGDAYADVRAQQPSLTALWERAMHRQIRDLETLADRQASASEVLRKEASRHPGLARRMTSPISRRERLKSGLGFIQALWRRLGAVGPTRPLDEDMAL